MKKFIQKAINKKHKGFLHKQLKIPKNKKIPLSLLRKIIKTPMNKNIGNPSYHGKKIIKVTHKLKSRSILALNIRKK